MSTDAIEIKDYDLPDGLILKERDNAETIYVRTLHLTTLEGSCVVIAGATIRAKKRVFVEVLIIPICGKFVFKAVPISVTDSASGKTITYGRKQGDDVMRQIVDSSINQLSANNEDMARNILSVSATSLT